MPGPRRQPVRTRAFLRSLVCLGEGRVASAHSSTSLSSCSRSFPLHGNEVPIVPERVLVGLVEAERGAGVGGGTAHFAAQALWRRTGHTRAVKQREGTHTRGDFVRGLVETRSLGGGGHRLWGGPTPGTRWLGSGVPLPPELCHLGAWASGASGGGLAEGVCHSGPLWSRTAASPWVPPPGLDPPRPRWGLGVGRAGGLRLSGWARWGLQTRSEDGPEARPPAVKQSRDVGGGVAGWPPEQGGLGGRSRGPVAFTGPPQSPSAQDGGPRSQPPVRQVALQDRGETQCSFY